jgi:hypothetical protein
MAQTLAKPGTSTRLLRKTVMRTKQVIAASLIALATSAAFADDITLDKVPAGSTVTRSQVKADVLKARASGQLLSAGEAYNGTPEPVGSNVARSEVKTGVLAARSNGQLLAAGEADPRGAREFAASSTRSRADVKAEVIAARKAGELMPAGEAYGGYADAHGKADAGTNPFTALAKAVHGKHQSDTSTQ